ncbi:MAG: hypothetical protein C4560_13870 [Nitrospiraceae bacterium]|nr:MAG: hypothetical protein C4560_13870 [Nitrospiraceae bacterium]
MKILLLGIGNAPVRFDSASFFFENLLDRKDENLDVITFGYNEGVDIRIGPEDDFEKVVNSLSPDWRPDCCILQGIDYNLLPRGIEKSPFPVVALPFPGDWDLDIIYTKAIAEAADLVIGAGYFDEENLPVIGADNVEIFYLGSVREKFFDPQPVKIRDRKYDLFYTATWFSDITHPERSEWAERLVKLSEKYNILIETRIKSYEEYLLLLRNSKMAFSHVRQGVFSNRVLEAASQGTVPVVTGKDVQRYFENGSEIVSVRAEDFFECVEGYLKNEDLLQEMSDRVHKKVSGDFMSESRFLSLLELIDRNLKEKKNIKRRAASLKKYESCIRNGEIYFYAYFRTINGGYFFTDKNTSLVLGLSIDEFRKAIKAGPAPRGRINLAVAMSALLFQQDGSRETGKKAGEIISLLEDVIAGNPSYVMAYFNLGLLYFRLGNHDIALEIFLKLVKLMEDGPYEMDPWCLQNRDYELFNHLLQKPLNENLLSLMKGEKKSADIAGLYHSAVLFFIAKIYEDRGDLYNALDVLLRAHALCPSNRLAVKRAAQLSAYLGSRQESLALYEKAIKLMPLDLGLRMEMLKSLYIYRKDKEMLRGVSELKKIASSIKSMRDRTGELKTFMESLGRFNQSSGCLHDRCTEGVLNEMIEGLYPCLKRNPHDIRLLFRIIELWHELGRVDKIIGTFGDYLASLGSPEGFDEETVSALSDVHRYIRESVEARKTFFNEKLDVLNSFIHERQEV